MREGWTSVSPEDRAAGAGGYRLAAGDLTVDVLEQGATIQRLFVPDAAGHVRNIVLGHSGPGDYRQSTGYLGAVVGRYANRIAGGRFELDGRQWVLAANEGTTTLHGGPDGFDRRLWTVLEVQGDRLTLQLVSPHGDGGFPGRLVVTVTYAVSPDRLRIDLSATTDAPTVVNLTNHSYFNLDGEDAPTIHEHALQVAAESYLPTGPDGIPTGEVASVEGTPFDLREARVLGEVLRAPHPQIAAAGGHSILLAGPPGTGKSMLASRLPGLLPPMTLAAALESAAVLSLAPLRWLGKLSYSLYLWHYPVLRLLRDQGDWRIVLLVGLPVSLALAALSYATVERWGLRMRARVGL